MQSQLSQLKDFTEITQAEVDWRHSGKFKVLMEFINKWDTEMAQNKLLIFSQTKKVLNIVETMLSSVGVDFVRMDGDVGLK